MTDASNIRQETQPNRRRISGEVVSNAPDKTVVVRISHFVQHPRYLKYIETNKRIKAHDEENAAGVGDTVTIEESHPISKDKQFVVVDRQPATAAGETAADDDNSSTV